MKSHFFTVMLLNNKSLSHLGIRASTTGKGLQEAILKLLLCRKCFASHHLPHNKFKAESLCPISAFEVQELEKYYIFQVTGNHTFSCTYPKTRG